MNKNTIMLIAGLVVLLVIGLIVVVVILKPNKNAAALAGLSESYLDNPELFSTQTIDSKFSIGL